ncbi:MAG TPA: type II toxin-antitoxin system HipA family toxin [Gammaproteobacteria bacterium]|nr:type II toxin-antitoxin system HipA family toxin [Gammaproteobacteria bacterium]
MKTDREAVVWTRCGNAPLKMGRFTVTMTECRFSYEPAYIDSGLPGLGVLYAPKFVGTTTIVWKRSPYFDLLPQLQALIPPASEDNFQRQLILSYLAQQNQMPEPGFDSDWAILMVSGHGGIGHLDVFSDDQQAREWYADTRSPELFPVKNEFGFSLKEFLSWLDDSAGTLLETLGPTPSVGGAIPKLLLSIPRKGWDGRIGLPTRGAVAGRTDIVLKFEKDSYPGIVELEALALDLHRQAGFDVPRYWTAEINGMPVIAVERYDRDRNGKPLFTETLYSVLATGDSRITHHYSSSYDAIGQAIDRSPIPIVSEPMQAKLHLLKRLLMSFVTGNGDLHLENLSLLQRKEEISFSPVYDPTPMRAYSRHNMISVMPFGNYGELDANDKPIDFNSAILRLSKNLGVNLNILKTMIEEILYIGRNYTQQIQSLSTLPEENKIYLSEIIREIRKKLSTIVSAQIQNSEKH